MEDPQHTVMLVMQPSYIKVSNMMAKGIVIEADPNSNTIEATPEPTASNQPQIEVENIVTTRTELQEPGAQHDLSNGLQENRGTQVIKETQDDDDEVMPVDEEEWARAVKEIAA